MGGDISAAADEIRAVGIPIISLNMVGSITEHVDLVVSDPVQAGTMAVMAIADTAAFDLERQRGRQVLGVLDADRDVERQLPQGPPGAVEKWLERAEPDVLLMQETKLSDADAPLMSFQMAGYELVHHGEGRWNGVAIATRGRRPRTSSRTSATGRSATAARARRGLSEDDFNPFDEARMLSAVCGGIRLVCLYAPNGRVVGSPFYDGKLQWFERLARWLDETAIAR